MALTEQKPALVVTYESAKPTKILLVELTVPWQFFKERQQGVKDWRKIWYRLALMHATSGIGCRGVRNAANLEYICNQVWIGSIKKLKGAFGRIALIGSYSIRLALNSKGLSGGELIKAQTWWHDFLSSCIFTNSNHEFIFHNAGSLGATDPSGNNPLSGPMRNWLCWEVIIPWKCYQPYAMYSSISPLNKELTSL